ncbi:DNA-3-methyladenine glycosylase 1 [Bienertia sinuspersici]
MSGGPRVRSTNLADSEQRPVLAPAGNKARIVVEARKPTTKPQRKADSSPETESKSKEKKQAHISPTFSPPLRNLSAPSILRHGNQLLRGNSSLNASCSSDASSDSSHSRASTGKISRSSVPRLRKKHGVASKLDMMVDSKVEKDSVDDGSVGEVAGLGSKKRCAWVTPNTGALSLSSLSLPGMLTLLQFGRGMMYYEVLYSDDFLWITGHFLTSSAEDPSYAAFHDEEWGVPLHDDNKLFELLSLSTALAELSWPTILNKRNTFREVFFHFDPISVSKLNEKKISGPGSPGSTLLSDLKLRNIVENARQVCKITEEFGSFDKYIWSFMNHKPLVNRFRYPRQVPVKTSKAEVISKDLVRRGFRGVGPTSVYSFMQAAGLTNDHLITCFRFQECIAAGEGIGKDDQTKVEEDKPIDMDKLEIVRALEEMSICSDC